VLEEYRDGFRRVTHAEVNAAVNAEREACANVCEAHSFRVRGFLDDDLLECKLADAIRNRGEA